MPKVALPLQQVQQRQQQPLPLAAHQMPQLLQLEQPQVHPRLHLVGLQLMRVLPQLMHPGLQEGPTEMRVQQQARLPVQQ